MGHVCDWTGVSQKVIPSHQPSMDKFSSSCLGSSVRSTLSQLFLRMSAVGGSFSQQRSFIQSVGASFSATWQRGCLECPVRPLHSAPTIIHFANWPHLTYLALLRLINAPFRAVFLLYFFFFPPLYCTFLQIVCWHNINTHYVLRYERNSFISEFLFQIFIEHTIMTSWTKA